MGLCHLHPDDDGIYGNHCTIRGYVAVSYTHLVWNTLQIRERCIENFEELILADNSQTDGKCMNCHVHGGNSGNLSMFHLREMCIRDRSDSG